MPSFATLLNTIGLSEFSDLIKKEFYLHQEKIKPAAAQLFMQEDLTGWSSDQKRYDEVDTETFARLKRQGENTTKARAGVGYSKTMTAKRVASEIDITWEMRRYGNQYAAKKQLTSLNGFVIHRTELDLTHRLTFATSTAYTDMDGESVDVTVGDGLALLSTAHTMKHVAGTYSNRVTGDPAFSQSSLELAESLFVTDVRSNFGDRRVMSADAIVTSDDPSTVNAVRRLLESTADVDAAQAGVTNVYKTKYRHVQLPYLATTATGANDATKKRWWFLVAIGEWQAHYGIFENANMKSPAEGNNLDDGHNDNWTYGTRGSYGICVVSGKGFVGSCPTN